MQVCVYSAKGAHLSITSLPTDYALEFMALNTFSMSVLVGGLFFMVAYKFPYLSSDSMLSHACCTTRDGILANELQAILSARDMPVSWSALQYQLWQRPTCHKDSPTPCMTLYGRVEEGRYGTDFFDVTVSRGHIGLG